MSMDRLIFVVMGIVNNTFIKSNPIALKAEGSCLKQHAACKPHLFWVPCTIEAHRAQGATECCVRLRYSTETKVSACISVPVA